MAAENTSDLKMKEEIEDMVVEDSAQASTGSVLKQEDIGAETVKMETLPFIKTNCLWETFDSNEVFRLYPQNPHFRPLEKEDEVRREGMALGFMVSFVSVDKMILRLGIEDPTSVIEEKLVALSKLEEHGFSVQPLRNRVENLLELKNRYN